MTRNRFARAAAALLVLGACGPGPRADADRVWDGTVPDQAVGSEVHALPASEPSGPVILVVGPHTVADPYSAGPVGLGRVFRLAAAAESGPIDDRAFATYADEGGAETWGRGAMFPGDLDGDGDDDLWLNAADPTIPDSIGLAFDLHGVGHVPWSTAWGSLVRGDPQVGFGANAACGDLDGDGAAELCGGSQLRVLPGPLAHGVNATSAAVGTIVDLPPYDAVTFGPGADVDGDGDAEALVCSSKGTCGMLSVLPIGPVSMTGLAQYTNEAGDLVAEPVADLDGDGLGDVLFGRYLYVGKDGGTPDDAWWVLDAGDLQVVAAATGDFDGDGHPDLAVGVGHDSDLKTRIYLGPLPNRTSTEDDIALIVPGGSLAAADVDGDGGDDLVVGLPTANDGAGQVQLFFGSRMFP